jgi:hypothetical protein
VTAAAAVHGEGAIPSTSELAVARVNAVVARAEPVGGQLLLPLCLSTRPFLTGMCLPMHAPCFVRQRGNGRVGVRGEIMGPGKYENVGESQPVLVMVDLIIFTCTRRALRCSLSACWRVAARAWRRGGRERGWVTPRPTAGRRGRARGTGRWRWAVAHGWTTRGAMWRMWSRAHRYLAPRRRLTMQRQRRRRPGGQDMGWWQRQPRRRTQPPSPLWRARRQRVAAAEWPSSAPPHTLGATR